jgi:dolichyl-diphosphooligosaccharide--protein glycosyltransferase
MREGRKKMSREALRRGVGGVGERLTSTLGRLSHLGISVSGKRLVEISAILLILFTAFTLRFLPIRWGSYLAEYDTYYQYRMANYVIDNGFPAWFTWHDNQSWYPWGRDIAGTSYPGVAFSAAFIYLSLNALGLNISLLTISMLFPVIMGTLTCLILYFFGKDIGGKEVGLFAAFFLAINSAYISRTSLGFFDDETIGVFGMVFAFFCFLRSLEEEKPLRNRLLYVFATGLSLCYVMISWGATRYVPAMLALYSFLMVLRGKYSRNLLISYTIPIGLSYALSPLIPVLGFKYLTQIDSIFILSLIPFLMVYDLFSHTEKISHKIILMIIIIAGLAGGLLILESKGYISSLGGKFLAVINPFTKTPLTVFETVAEHRRSSWASFFSDFGVVLSLSLVGSYFSIRRIDSKRFFILLYFITSLYFAGSMIRLTLILSAASCLMAAYGIVELVKPFMETVLGSKLQESRRRRLMPKTSPELAAIFLIVLFLIATPTIVDAVERAYSPGQLAMSGVPARLSTGEYPQDWIEALTWMRNNLNSKTILASWWDYGYWLTGIGNVTTLADGGTLNGTQISWLAKAYMYNQTESLKILQRYDAEYILVFISYNPASFQPWGGTNTWPPTGPGLMWPLADNVKWEAMEQIAGLNLSDYITYNSANGQTVWTEKFKETAIYNLMFEQADPGHFQLVFRSSYLGYVLIYKIKY